MSPSLLLRLSILVGLLAISATARPGRPFHPCKTLILFSTTSSSLSFDLYQTQTQNQNQNQNQNPYYSFSGPRSITVFFTEIRPINDHRPIFIEKEDLDHQQNLPSSFPLYSSVSASFRDRSKDILRVVGSLLFGVGSGALTAATLYLVWSFFVPARFSEDDDEFDSETDDDDDVDDDDVSLMKKAGYVAIPCPSPAKEVV